jgi:hypothetical protein
MGRILSPPFPRYTFLSVTGWVMVTSNNIGGWHPTWSSVRLPPIACYRTHTRSGSRLEARSSDGKVRFRTVVQTQTYLNRTLSNPKLVFGFGCWPEPDCWFGFRVRAIPKSLWMCSNPNRMNNIAGKYCAEFWLGQSVAVATLCMVLPILHMPDVQQCWCLPSRFLNPPTVADDSSLHQAIKLKLKGNKRACQDLQPSLTRRQVTRLHFKTIAECLKPLYLLCKVRERSVTLGKCGWESRGQVRLILRNTEGLYTTALQLLTDTMSHVRWLCADAACIYN